MITRKETEAKQPNDATTLLSAIYELQQRGKFCDLRIELAGKSYLVNKVIMAAESEYLMTNLSDDWMQHECPRTGHLITHEVPRATSQEPEAKCGKQPADVDSIEIDLPFLTDPDEKHATFETILQYMYSGTISETTMTQDKWFNLIQAADYLIIQKLFVYLTNYFKDNFTNPVEPSPQILLLYQQCSKYQFLFSLSEHICQFIKANLNRILFCLKRHAQQEIGCIAQADSDDDIDLDGDYPDIVDQEIDGIPAHFLEGATDEHGNILVRVNIGGRIQFMNEHEARRSQARRVDQEQNLLNSPIPLDKDIPLEKLEELEPDDYDQSELLRICSALEFRTIESILEQGRDFMYSPRVGDLDVFFLIMAWAGAHQTLAPNISARRALRSNMTRHQRYMIPHSILRNACTLLQRYMVKDMNAGKRTTDRLLREKSDRGKADVDVFRQYMDQSPTKTPAKRHAQKFFTDELERYHPISKVWRARGAGSYNEFETCCYELFNAWLKIGEIECGPPRTRHNMSLKRTYIEKIDDLYNDDLVHQVVPFPAGSARKRKADAIDIAIGDSSDDETEAEQLIPRIPYQAPLVVGSWCGKNEQDKDYGPSSDMHVWDDSRNVWTKNPSGLSLPCKLCYNGRAYLEPYLYIFGGYDGQRSNSTGMDQAYKINVVTLECIEIAPLNVKRLYITGCSLGGDAIVALGGSSNKKASKIKRYIEQTGDSSFINDSGRMCVVEEYIIKENRWRRLPNMQSPRSDASATSFNDVVYVAGGFDGKECLDTVEMYVRDFHQWTSLPPMKRKRSGLSLLIYQGNLLALCGFGGKASPHEENGDKKKGRHRTVECLPLDRASHRYNHRTKESWRELGAQLNEGRSNFGACVLNDNQIVVCGGFNTGTLKSCERWHGTLEEVKSLAYPKFEKINPARGYKKDGWHTVQDLPIEMSAMSVVTISTTDRPLSKLLRPRPPEMMANAEEYLEMEIITDETNITPRGGRNL